MAELPIASSSLAEVVRSGRHVLTRFLVPAKVLSTCHVNGGFRKDLLTLVNHQSCEPVKHHDRFDFIVSLGQAGYQKHVCEELGLDADKTAVMGTAAAMQYLGVVTHSWADLSVTAIVTAGVTGNAGCAGDEACYDESNGTWVKTTPSPNKEAGTTNGTINTVLLFSSPLSDSALARTAMTMTEAKTSALMSLAIGSKSSWRLATGTGTDQYAIAAPQDGPQLRTWTGKHTKAGELAGRAVREATLEALRWQNGLEPSYTRSIFHALGRFGITEDKFKPAMERLLDVKDSQLLKDNWNPVIYEPQLAAACYAYAAVLDRVLCGTIGPSSARESIIHQAALMAAGLSGKPESFAQFRADLIPHFAPKPDCSAEALLPAAAELAFRAVALGWQRKWQD